MMKNYVGIDLGTTNSAIATFDGELLRLYKSPEQNDVTPSAIFIDRRGNKYVGQRAYDNAARNPDNAATLFKRLMGSNTPICLKAVDKVLRPEDCSAEILRVLYGYLPEEVRNDPQTGTVITVPAAFNQMQKDASLAAAEAAGLGKVALMQEPVAAVMSVMRQRKVDGIFLVYDLGGGTLDVAIAQSIDGRVSLLAHGGIALCGGRDFDRLMMETIVKPWLLSNFDLPTQFASEKPYSSLIHMVAWAAERAKIDLSCRPEAVISLSECELGVVDRQGKDIYVDIALTRMAFDALIQDKVNESIVAVRDTLAKAGLSPRDMACIVFIGGPSQYKPLRDQVAQALGIAASTEVNPMTAVAEGAAVFAESIDWSSANRSRKSGRGAISAQGSEVQLKFSYPARTPDKKAKLVAKLAGQILPGAAFQLDSLDTGWTSGSLALKQGASVEVPLSKAGDNTFKLFAFDGQGGPVALSQEKIVIARTAAQIDAIPASHSVGVEAREKLGGRFVLDYLVHEGDALPKRGKRVFKADETLHAGAPSSLKFKLWEGTIDDPVSDNRFIGMFEIRGSDFAQGVIGKGADLVLEYEVLDSGNIRLDLTVPSIGSSFQSGRNFYARQSGQIDFSVASQHIIDEARQVAARIDSLAQTVDDSRLGQALRRIERAAAACDVDGDPELAQQAMDNVQEAKKLLAATRKAHLKIIRQMELDNCVRVFKESVSPHARASELSTFNTLVGTAQRAIVSGSGDFDLYLQELRGQNWDILLRQDSFVVARFNWLAKSAQLFPDMREFAALVEAGRQALQRDDTHELRQTLDVLESTRLRVGVDEEPVALSNILIA